MKAVRKQNRGKLPAAGARGRGGGDDLEKSVLGREVGTGGGVRSMHTGEK